MILLSEYLNKVTETREVSCKSELKACEREFTIYIPNGEQLEILDNSDQVGFDKIKINFEVGRDSSLKYRFSYGSPHDKKNPDSDKKIEKELIFKTSGRGAEIDAQCFVYTQGREYISIVSKQDHKSSQTKSNMTLRAVSGDNSKVSSESLIFIDKGIEGIQAEQLHTNLVRGERVRVYSDPKLEVLSDDVSCSHGAAIKHINEIDLFYLQSRGYTRENAEKSLIAAFIAE